MKKIVVLKEKTYEMSRGATSEGVSCVVLRPVKIINTKEVKKDEEKPIA